MNKKGLRCSEDELKFHIQCILEMHHVEPLESLIEEIVQKIKENYILLAEFNQNS